MSLQPGATVGATLGVTLGVTADDLVTGEAVALDLPAASLGMRMLSGLIDLFVIQMAASFVMTIASMFAVHADDAVAAGIMLLATVAVLVGYPVTLETLTRGRTVGKLATGLRTLRDDGGPITFRHALARGLTGVVEVYLLFGMPAVIAAVINPRTKRMGDMAAGTFVVRERGRGRLSTAVPMPPHLAGWAMSADIAPLPDDLAAALRSFLPAAFQMDPGARDQQGRELYEEVRRYLSPQPPPGVHPEYVMAAVVAERRRRDHARLLAEAALRDRLTPPERF